MCVFKNDNNSTKCQNHDKNERTTNEISRFSDENGEQTANTLKNTNGNPRRKENTNDDDKENQNICSKLKDKKTLEHSLNTH